ncbi:transcription initiation factor B [Halorhabdus tiamatea SARL4B]|uniref:Transcription initiation factor B n=1 Tax=Halorhabdus tiamatea SARL4B TaxID=1033806 RepID=S6D701_9EURY|nr:transcription initiation factor B [Halorhabdus tiamatea SARL4B]
MCEDCGLVTSENRIDRGPEWRAFNQQEREEKSRVGAPTTDKLHDKGLSTNIDWQNRDASGTPLSKSKQEQMDRLREWNTRSKTATSADRTKQTGLAEVQRMASALGLPEHVEETACVMLKQCVTQDLMRGRSIEGMATACITLAARQCNCPRQPGDVYSVSRLQDPSRVDSDIRYVARELGVEAAPADPREYIPGYVDALDVDDPVAVRETAVDMLDTAENENLHSGRAPTAIAAAAVYSATVIHIEGITQVDVAQSTDASAVTIGKRYPEILNAYGVPQSA